MKKDLRKLESRRNGKVIQRRRAEPRVQATPTDDRDNEEYLAGSVVTHAQAQLSLPEPPPLLSAEEKLKGIEQFGNFNDDLNQLASSDNSDSHANDGDDEGDIDSSAIYLPAKEQLLGSTCVNRGTIPQALLNFDTGNIPQQLSRKIDEALLDTWDQSNTIYTEDLLRDGLITEELLSESLWSFETSTTTETFSGVFSSQVDTSEGDGLIWDESW